MKTQSSIIITSLLLIISFNACNTKTSSQFNNYNIALDSIISGYDSKDLDIYTEAQRRIISNINIYDKIQKLQLSYFVSNLSEIIKNMN